MFVAKDIYLMSDLFSTTLKYESILPLAVCMREASLKQRSAANPDALRQPGRRL